MKDPVIGDWAWCIRDNAPFVDKRTIPDQSVPGGTPRGFAFAALDPASAVPVGAIYLGDFLDDQPPDRIAFEQALGLTSGDVAGATLADGWFQTLTEYADMTGQSHVKPLMPGRQKDGSFEIRLHLRGHSIIKRETFDPVRHLYVYETLKYRIPILKQRFPEHYRKEFWAWEQEYGFKIADIAPGEVSERPGTDKSDTFVEGGNTDLSSHTATGPDSGFSWGQKSAAQILVVAATDTADRTAGGSSWEWGRAEFDFSGNNLNAQIDCTNVSPTTETPPTVPVVMTKL